MVTVTEVKPIAANVRPDVKRCAIYIRVSTAEQRLEGWSLEAQQASLLALAHSKGWKVVGVYADEGKTARKELRKRKAIKRLLDDVRAGEIDIILFKELDRWFRNISDFYKVQDVLDQYGVEWFSQQQPSLEMKTKEGRLQVNVLLSVGQNETDATSDRIKYTHKFLRSQKRWAGSASNLPRCYTLDEEQHVIFDPDPERGPFVLELIERVRRYGSVRRALRETNAEHEKPMGYTNAINMIKNPMLYGEYKEVPDFVENPLLTKKEWGQLQTIFERNATDTKERLYIFAGLIRCSGCGCILRGTFTKGQYKEYFYYKCRRATLEASCSQTYQFPEIRMEKELLEYVKTAVADKIVHVEKVTQARKTRKPRKSNRAQIDRQLDKLEDVYISSDRMTKEKYEAKKAAILAKLIPEDEPEERLPALADLQKIQELFDSGVEEIYQTFTKEERREFWRGIVSEIKVEGNKIVDVDFIA